MHTRIITLMLAMRKIPSVLRILLLGPLLLIGGLLGGLPVLGFWMLPLGILVICLDFRWARNLYAKTIRALRRRRHAKHIVNQQT